MTLIMTVGGLRRMNAGVIKLNAHVVPNSDQDPAIEIFAKSIDPKEPVKVGRLDHLMRMAHLIHDEKQP